MKNDKEPRNYKLTSCDTQNMHLPSKSLSTLSIKCYVDLKIIGWKTNE